MRLNLYAKLKRKFAAAGGPLSLGGPPRATEFYFMTATPQAQAELVQLQIAFPGKRLANLEACEKAQFADDEGNPAEMERVPRFGTNNGLPQPSFSANSLKENVLGMV